VADFLFFYFFKQYITFLLILLPSASFNDAYMQMDPSKLLKWLQGYLFFLSSSPWKLQVGSSVVPVLCKHVAWWKILMCEELTACLGGRTQQAA